MSYGFKIMVEGDYASYNRPEMKVERVSYDVPTPGAIEGMLKSVYWKPPVRYVIDRIIVFNPIKFTNVRRNEVKTKLLASGVKAQMKGKNNDIFIYADENRNQRSAMLLKDVKYGIEFHFEMTGIRSDHADESEEKHYSIIKRRLEKGQCFRQPCLGCGEFPVKKLTLVDDFNMDEISPEIIAMGDVDLGFMCYRMNFRDGGKPVRGDWNNPIFSDEADAVYYRPHMIRGIIDVAKYRRDVKC